MKRFVLTCAAAPALVPLSAGPATAAPPNIYHTITSTHAYAVLAEQDEQSATCTRIFLSSSAAMYAYAAQPGPVDEQGLTGVLVRVTEGACSGDGVIDFYPCFGFPG